MTDKDENASVPIIPTKAAIEIVEAATGGLSDGLRGTVSDVWGGLVGDRVREWRTRNLIGTLEKTKEYLDEKNISISQTRALPNADLYQIFDGASKVDSGQLTDMWAKLLAAAMDPKEVRNRRLFGSILEQIDGVGAEIFQIIYWYEVRKEKIVKDARQQEEAAQKTEEEVQNLEAFNKKIEEIRESRAELISSMNKYFSKRINNLGDEEKTFESIANLRRLSLIMHSDLLSPPNFEFNPANNDHDALSFELSEMIERTKEWIMQYTETSLGQDNNLLEIREGFNQSLTFKCSTLGRSFGDVVVGSVGTWQS